MDYKVLISKKAFAAYAALAILIATAFGYGDKACAFAATVGIDTLGMCNAPATAAADNN